MGFFTLTLDVVKTPSSKRTRDVVKVFEGKIDLVQDREAANRARSRPDLGAMTMFIPVRGVVEYVDVVEFGSKRMTP